MITYLKIAIKIALAPILYRHFPIGLRPARLHLWLDSLRDTRGVPGTIMEVGVAVGGTAAFCWNYLRYVGDDRQYVCVDTFGGFVAEQFEKDVELGNSWDRANIFRANSEGLVRKILDMHGATDVGIVKADISKMPMSQMPAAVSACLLDVDLAVPIYDGLKLLWPCLSSGGVILVDDCTETSGWQALKGVQKFSAETGIEYQLMTGMAIFKKQKG